MFDEKNDSAKTDSAKTFLANSLRRLRSQMDEAAKRAGRDPSAIRLVAVSKTKGIDLIRAAYEEGQLDFGENYVQELVPKMDQLQSSRIRWHFIGPLQSNKVRKIMDPKGIGQVSLIHSVDRASVLQEIARQCGNRGVSQDVLIQVNVAEEDSKNGVSVDGVDALVEEALKLQGVRVRGLMAMPPLTNTAEQNRAHFRVLREIFDALKVKFFDNELDSGFSELSMGTSQDFEVAIEEGATLIRVGTQVFGSRETPER